DVGAQRVTLGLDQRLAAHVHQAHARARQDERAELPAWGAAPVRPCHQDGLIDEADGGASTWVLSHSGHHIAGAAPVAVATRRCFIGVPWRIRPTHPLTAAVFAAPPAHPS